MNTAVLQHYVDEAQALHEGTMPAFAKYTEMKKLYEEFNQKPAIDSDDYTYVSNLLKNDLNVYRLQTAIEN